MHEKINQQQGAFKTERSFGFANPVSDWGNGPRHRREPYPGKCVSLGQPTARLFCAASSREISSTSSDVMPGARCHELAGEPRRIQLGSQRLFEFGPSMKREFCVIPRTWFRCGSSRTSQSRVMISRSVCDCSATTCSTARKANASNVSLLCSKADRIEGE